MTELESRLSLALKIKLFPIYIISVNGLFVVIKKNNYFDSNFRIRTFVFFLLPLNYGFV